MRNHLPSTGDGRTAFRYTLYLPKVYYTIVVHINQAQNQTIHVRRLFAARFSFHFTELSRRDARYLLEITNQYRAVGIAQFACNFANR